MKTTIKISAFLLLLITAFADAFGQVPAWQWANHQNQASINRKIVADASGNIVTAGNSLSTYTSSGALLWTKNLQNADSMVAVTGLSLDSRNNLYLTGSFTGTIHLDTVSLTSFLGKDIFIAKFSPNGAILWARQAGGTSGQFPIGTADDGVSAIATDTAGNSYITGTTLNSTVQFDTLIFTAATGKFVARYNSRGKIEWVRNLDRYASSIAVNQSGNYYLTGQLITPSNLSTFYVEKYDLNGALLWRKDAVKTPGPGTDMATGIVLDNQENCFITGWITSNTTFENHNLQPSPYSQEMFLIKCNSAGVLQWAKQSQGMGVISSNNTLGSNCVGLHLTTDAPGNVFITGDFTEKISFGGTLSPLISQNSFNTPYTRSDMFVVKYTNAGMPVWAKTAGGTQFSNSLASGTGVALLPNGDCVVAGNYRNICKFDNLTLVGSATNVRSYLAKLSVNPLGISENETTGNFRLYPNPATSDVTITNPDFKEGSITVFNATGQKVYETQTRGQGNVSLQTETWPSGIYLVKCTAAETTVTRKLIVSH